MGSDSSFPIKRPRTFSLTQTTGWLTELCKRGLPTFIHPMYHSEQNLHSRDIFIVFTRSPLFWPSPVFLIVTPFSVSFIFLPDRLQNHEWYTLHDMIHDTYIDFRVHYVDEVFLLKIIGWKCLLYSLISSLPSPLNSLSLGSEGLRFWTWREVGTSGEETPPPVMRRH